jgi:hypothetical protein
MTTHERRHHRAFTLKERGEMQAIFNSLDFWQWVVQVLVVFFFIGSVVGTVVGVGLIFRSSQALKAFSTLNR